ncbi:DNA-directed RNA polymerase [Brevundimonas sp. BH3]|uniref:DNA-directed RNA polymerase n=1 Tax=Brevundimonas sp. BH3 TaxID=3133089 RepID=UPI00324D2225
MEKETFAQRARRQLALENESRAIASDRYKRSRPTPWRDDIARQRDEADMLPAKTLLSEAVGPVVEEIDNYKKAVEAGHATRRPQAYYVLEHIKSAEAALIAGRVIVSAVVTEQPMTATAVQVGRYVLEHIQMNRLKKQSKPAYDGVLRVQKGHVRSDKMRRHIQSIFDKSNVQLEIDRATLLHVGAKLIELFCDATGFFRIEAKSNYQTQKVIRAEEAVIKWFDAQHSRCELLSPIYMPMVCRPRQWRSLKKGGYISRFVGINLVKNPDRSYLKDLEQTNLSVIFDAVNAAQNVAWKINSKVYEVAAEAWATGGRIAGLPARHPDDLPPRPASLDQMDEWKAEAHRVYTTNAQMVSPRLAIQQKLWIAQKFKDEDAIWFPHHLDFRGRIYPVGNAGPNPQGDDLSRSLIHFQTGKPLGQTGAFWLAVHIANLFGQDKIPFKDRVAWTHANTKLLLDSANDPLDGQRFWTTADKPWCALAAIFEWAGYTVDGDNHISHIQVAMDGSNSGLQHFSALLRDPVGAAAVNLLPQSLPSDIYRDVAEAVIANLKDDPHPSALAWAGKVNRKITKRPVMTYVYSATKFGFGEQIKETIETEGLDLKARDANYLAGHIWDALQDTVAAASEAMGWLRECAKVFADANLPMRWTTPCGLLVQQRYMKSRTQRVMLCVGGKELRLHLRRETDGINRRSMANAIAPNFIHSMDATHLMAVVNKCADDAITLSVVHDSFATHPCDVEDMRTILKDKFYELYQYDWLTYLRDEFLAQLPAEYQDRIPPTPAMGSFDISLVKQSEFLFA